MSDAESGSVEVGQNSMEGTEDGGNGATNETLTEMRPEARQEFLLEAVRREPILRALETGSTSASGLTESVDLARSTVHRATKSLEEYGLVHESDGEYRLTSLGEIVAEETRQFGARAWTAMSLHPFLNSINMNGNRIPIEHFTDAKITRRKPRQPHTTIHRIITLLTRSDELRMFSTVISPVYVDIGHHEMMNGMEIEAIFDREVVDIMLSEYPEKAQDTISTGNFDVYAHDGLPFELFVFDNRIGLAAHNEMGTAETLIECTDPAAIEWAEELYAEKLAEADPLLNSEL